MIFKVESKILKWMSENILLIALGAAVLLSLILRVSLRGFYTSDADLCLIPWYEAIKANGGIRGLAVPVEGLNYNFPYQFCIAIMTYIPIYPLYAYKILSAIFDYLLAFMVGKIVFEVAQENKKEKAIFAAIAVMLSPLVFLVLYSLYLYEIIVFNIYCYFVTINIAMN